MILGEIPGGEDEIERVLVGLHPLQHGGDRAARALEGLAGPGGAQQQRGAAGQFGTGLPQIGAAEPVSAATEALEQADALLVVEGGKPLGVITRQDLLGHLSHRAKG